MGISQYQILLQKYQKALSPGRPRMARIYQDDEVGGVRTHERARNCFRPRREETPSPCASGHFYPFELEPSYLLYKGAS